MNNTEHSQEKQTPKIAFFDFDGTISKQDTFFPFIMFFSDQSGRFIRLWLSTPYFFILLCLYMCKIMTNHTIKQKIMVAMLKGISEEEIDRIAEQFVGENLEKYVKPDIFSLLQKHLDQKHEVIIVSANLDVFLVPWAKKYGIKAVVSTQLEVDEQAYLTGRIAGRNCYGPEKVRRIKEYLGATHIKDMFSYGYGDSKGDYEMLDFVHEPYWVDGVVVTKWQKRK